MSDSIFVMLKKENMPSAKEWEAQIKKEGFGLTIDTSYEEETDADGVYGFRPCTYYSNEDLGYELDITSREDSSEDFECWDDDFPEVKAFELAVIFGVYNEEDVYAAMVAGGVLAKMAGGIYFDVDMPVDLDELYLKMRKIDEDMKQQPYMIF